MYDLYSLGWHSFQQLCLTVTREILGQTVESFLDTADGGRDGAFAGTWKRKSAEALAGRFVVQCKFTGKRQKNLKAEDLLDEVKKAERLVETGRCDSYVVMTNAGVSGAAAEEIEALFAKAGVKQIAIFGSTWICDQIRENKRLRIGKGVSCDYSRAKAPAVAGRNRGPVPNSGLPERYVAPLPRRDLREKSSAPFCPFCPFCPLFVSNAGLMASPFGLIGATILRLDFEGKHNHFGTTEATLLSPRLARWTSTCDNFRTCINGRNRS
jgi:hypothetical protein